jgi:guanylate kinase
MTHTLFSAGQLYLISAPSGAGKTTLVKALLDLDENIRVSVSHTTRQPREGEQAGVDYHFVEKSAFEQTIAEQGFLEYAAVYGNYYGTEKRQVEALLHQGVDVILEIDWQGAQQVKARIPHAIRISIAPPSAEALRERLQSRGLDQPDVIEKRMEQAREELSHINEAEYMIVNDSFAEALFELRSIFVAQRQRVIRQRKTLEALGVAPTIL